MKGQGFSHYKNYGLDLLFKSLSIHYLYFNNVGLKEFNSRLDNIKPNDFKQTEFTLEMDQTLYCLPDFLYDDFTFVQMKIEDSPHYDLMEHLYNGQSIKNSTYVQRSKAGSLDMRPAYNYKASFYEAKYVKRKQEIDNNLIKPILVNKVNNLYYILDGKHRAALLKVLKRPCPCICLENFDLKQYYAAYWKKIQARNATKFKKHLAFYSQL